MKPQVWLVRLWAPPARLDRLRRLLSPEERERADRFVFDRLRPPFIVAHAALRIVVARALGADPTALRFTKGQYGKPRLRDTALELNLSHSGDWAMIALGHEHPVGVDIEGIHPPRVSPGMIEAVTSTTERAAFEAMPPERRAEPFFRLWVRKEAVIKALGTGLSRPLDSIDVPLGPEAPADGVVLRPEPDPRLRSWLWDLAAPLGYFGALVVRQPRDQTPLPPEPVQVLTLDELDA
ncbi:MAG: 4'-phosphopantetheinyl transferase superfamily protein [Myxococcota bacterium]